MVQVSIIIVNYNTKELTKNCLDSIYQKTENISYEIVVIDNASTDGTQDMIKQEFKEVILIESNKNLGFGRANNLGIERAKGKYVFLLNSDTILLNNAVKIFFDYMEKNEQVGVCGGNLYNEDMTEQASYGNFPKLSQQLLSTFLMYKILPEIYKKYFAISDGIVEKEKSVDFICGADMFISKKVLEEVGYFDKDFFMYYEETELCHRIRKAKYDIKIIPDVKIIHLCGKSTGDDISDKKFLMVEESKYKYFKKIYGVIGYFIIRKLINISYVIKYLVSFNQKYINHFKLSKMAEKIVENGGLKIK